jgi:hypothetical protein
LAEAIYRLSLIISFLLPLPILSQADLLLFWPVAGFCAIACGTLVHELGHAFGCVAAGGRVAMLAIYPVAIDSSPLRVRWLPRRRFWFATGRTEYVFGKRHGERYMLATAGGPCADALVASLSYATLNFAAPSPGAQGFLVALMAQCTLQVISNLLPCSGSDGRSLLNIARANRLQIDRAGSRAGIPNGGSVC